MRGLRSLIALFSVVMLLMGAVAPVLAQEASPATGGETGDDTAVISATDREAFIPSPDECTSTPLTTEEISEITSTGPETSPASADATDIPFGAPDGTPADEETAAAVTAAIRESWACLNGGDWARFFAYLSDDEIRRSFGPDAVALARQPVAPYQVSDQTAVYAVLDVEVLPDGRVGAFVIVDSSGDPLPVEINYQIAVETESGWKLDGFICFAGTGTTC